MIRFCFLIGMLVLASCASEPKDVLVRRWQIADVSGYGGERLRREVAEAASENRPAPTSELEFTGDGRFIMYENGVMKSEGLYSLASDGKSLLLKDPQGRDSEPVQILQLTSGELRILSRVFGRDTVLLKAR